MLKLAFLFLSLTLITLTLHIQKHSLQKRYDQSKYLDALQKKQDQFTEDLANIALQIQAINAEFNATNQTQSVTLSKVQEGIAQERDSLYNIESYLNLPLNLKACTCVNFTDEKREEMKQTLKKLSGNIETLKSKVKDCDECPLVV